MPAVGFCTCVAFAAKKAIEGKATGCGVSANFFRRREMCAVERGAVVENEAVVFRRYRLSELEVVIGGCAVATHEFVFFCVLVVGQHNLIAIHLVYFVERQFRRKEVEATHCFVSEKIERGGDDAFVALQMMIVTMRQPLWRAQLVWLQSDQRHARLIRKRSPCIETASKVNAKEVIELRAERIGHQQFDSGIRAGRATRESALRAFCKLHERVGIGQRIVDDDCVNVVVEPYNLDFEVFRKHGLIFLFLQMRCYTDTGTTPPSFSVISRAVWATSGPNFRMRSSERRAMGPASDIAPSGSEYSS